MAIQSNKLSSAAYERNFSDIHPPFGTRDAALVDANRCLYCYDAPCTKRCPTSIDIPRFIHQISTGDIRGSAHTILEANIMGSGCSRVCPVEKLCEGACVYNLMEEQPIPIARLQRYATDQALVQGWSLFVRKAPVGKRVAIVGAGPAGLSCAHALAREGIDVTIFERESKAGGLMTYGIAAYKVTPAFVAAELAYILAIGGIRIEYGRELGRDLELEELRNEFDAVFLAFGVGLARRLNIPGEELEGVVDAISFIYAIRSSDYSSVPVGDKVAVIGLGMTAIDAATQARRLGAKEVTIVYRRTEAEMPCTEAELEIAKQDGCRLLWLAAPLTLKGDEGKVSQLVCQLMRLGEPDASGRCSPVATGETQVLDVDMVIKAAGQMPFEDMVVAEGLRHVQGRVSVSAPGHAPGFSGSDHATNIPGVFAGGDCVNGGKEVVDAVQAGKDAARAVIDYLKIPLNGL